MKLSRIKEIVHERKSCRDITVTNNHNFFCNGVLIHNCDYRGELMVCLFNHGYSDYVVNVGDRIAQLVFAPVVQAKFVTVDELGETERGTGGWGSTGK